MSACKGSYRTMVPCRLKEGHDGSHGSVGVVSSISYEDSEEISEVMTTVAQEAYRDGVNDTHESLEKIGGYYKDGIEVARAILERVGDHYPDVRDALQLEFHDLLGARGSE